MIIELLKKLHLHLDHGRRECFSKEPIYSELSFGSVNFQVCYCCGRPFGNGYLLSMSEIVFEKDRCPCKC